MQSGRIAGSAAKAHSAFGGMAAARSRVVWLFMVFERFSGLIFVLGARIPTRRFALRPAEAGDSSELQSVQKVIFRSFGSKPPPPG